MKKVNLKDLYPDVYKNDHFVEVTEDVLETIRAAERAEAAYDRRMYRYKAHYSLDCDNGIENAILMKPQTPEMLLEEKQLREQLYAAVMALPEKQAKRIYARYYLGMRVSEIAAAEGVDPSRVRESIQDDHDLRLHNLDLPVGKIVTAFVENGLEVSEAHTCEESLEDYFKRVTGGEGIA